MKMRKLFAVWVAILAFGLMSSMASAAAETVNVGDLIKDQAGWEGGSVSFDGGKATFAANDGPGGYTAKKFQDATFDMKVTFDLASSWPGFQLRSTTPVNHIWEGGSGYLFIFKEDIIEVQKWVDGKETRIADVPNDGKYKSGTAHAIQIGTVNEDGGVRLTVVIDGKEAFNQVDAGGITQEGAFGVYSYKTSTVVEGNGAAAPAPAEGDDAATTLPKTGSNVPVEFVYGLAALLAAAAVYIQLRKRQASRG
jgi:LPXTG-motif cell wall-anchored protein